ncbi:hypothetical protein GCM10010260_30420 [Streptomyces filipinensis]|uniref:Uncharacterized protein n=1 Tax=Streptomyces filipinensis TaxID=66887 RepID=A0A918IAF3_9ACTN|nr:hypothetical protein GCM10010260_30420 [Streptomyces filipinensis]
MQGHLAAPSVQAGVDEDRGACRAEQVRAHLQHLRWHESPWRWKTDPCSSLLPILWMLVTQMPAPASIAHVGRSGWKGRCAPQALVHDQRHPAAVADLGHRAQVRARTVRGGAGGQRALRVRMRPEGRLELVRRRRMSERPLRVPARLHPDGCDPRQDQARDDRLVGVPADQELLVPATASMAALTDSELPQVV